MSSTWLGWVACLGPASNRHLPTLGGAHILLMPPRRFCDFPVTRSRSITVVEVRTVTRTRSRGALPVPDVRVLTGRRGNTQCRTCSRRVKGSNLRSCHRGSRLATGPITTLATLLDPGGLGPRPGGNSPAHSTTPRFPASRRADRHGLAIPSRRVKESNPHVSVARFSRPLPDRPGPPSRCLGGIEPPSPEPHSGALPLSYRHSGDTRTRTWT